jgi:hypothetical protein
VLYTVIAEHLETFRASCHDDPEATGLPAYVQREFYNYLRCGILAHGLLRLGCDTCKQLGSAPLPSKPLAALQSLATAMWDSWHQYLQRHETSPHAPTQFRGPGLMRRHYYPQTTSP